MEAQHPHAGTHITVVEAAEEKVAVVEEAAAVGKVEEKAVEADGRGPGRREKAARRHQEVVLHRVAVVALRREVALHREVAPRMVVAVALRQEVAPRVAVVGALHREVAPRVAVVGALRQEVALHREVAITIVAATTMGTMTMAAIIMRAMEEAMEMMTEMMVATAMEETTTITMEGTTRTGAATTTMETAMAIVTTGTTMAMPITTKK